MVINDNSNFLFCYKLLDDTEANFIKNIINYIIYYPIDWYNFLENILKNKLMINYRNNAIIISLEILTPQLKNSFDHIYDVMKRSGVILSVIETKGFLIIYVYSKVISDFFQNSGFWLEYITDFACFELGLNSYRGGLIKTNDGRIQEIDVVVQYDSNLFFIECKDTYNYTHRDLKKIYNLKKKVNLNTFGVFVCSKLAYDIDYDRYEIGLIKYKFNYFNFKEELKDYIGNKLISLN